MKSLSLQVILPQVAQRDVRSCELALDLPLTSGHFAVLDQSPRTCKQAGGLDETSYGGSSSHSGCLLCISLRNRGKMNILFWMFSFFRITF
jgi:hypothetical protein